MLKNLRIVFYFVALPSLIAAQQQFTNNGNLMIHAGGRMSVYGDFVNNGNFADSGTVLTLAGTTAQQLGGTSVTVFKNLTLNNAGGAYLSSNQSISGELNISSGTFTTTGYDFRLLSNAYGTARIAPILGDITGNITMERYISGPTDWRFLASPVTGATIGDWEDDFYTSGFPGSAYPAYWFTSIYSYDETVPGTSDNGYVAPTDSSNVLVPGTGYWCYIGPSPITVDVTGPPAKFTQTLSVSYSPSSGGSSEDGYVMVGNPYPCPIDWSASGWTKHNINDAIYIWNPVLQQYASWVSGTAINGGSNLIASSQSFWVQTNGSNPVLNCDESIKVSSNSAFLRPIAPAGYDNLKLVIEGNGFVDETLIRFGSTATKSFDSQADARKLFSTNPLVPGIASEDSTLQDLSVNSLPAIDSQVHIPLKALVGVSGTYTLRTDSSAALSSDFCVVLEDLATGTKINLGTLSSYSFDIEDTTKAARFLIHISAPHETSVVAASCSNYHDGKAIAVAKGAGPWNYSWFNSSNVLLRQVQNSFTADTLQQLAAGAYTVQIDPVGGQCASSSMQVYVPAPSPVIAGFNSADTLVLGDSLMLQNYSFGAQTYTWDFGDNSTDNSAAPTAHHYNQQGEYQVRLIAFSGICSDTMMKKVVVTFPNTVGLKNNSLLSGITVYPNPNNGLFYVDAGEKHTEQASLFVYSISGELLFEQKLESGKTQIDLQQFAKGMYLYQIHASEAVISGRVILQ